MMVVKVLDRIMSKLTNSQTEEISRCAVDFPYFCKNYIKLDSLGTCPFLLRPYQVELYDHIEDNRFSIFSKFRRGGFTTELAIYGLWISLFRLDQRILWISNSDFISKEVCDKIVKRAIQHIPDWMRGNVMKMTNSRQKSFPDTDSEMYFSSFNTSFKRTVNLLVVDEASFIKDMDNHWKCIYPCLSNGGRAIVFSNPRFDNDWFWNTLQDSHLKLNSFVPYSCHYKDNPEFNNEWEIECRKTCGKGLWELEYEQIPMLSILPEAIVKPLNRQWRSILDEWDVSMFGDKEGLK